MQAEESKWKPVGKYGHIMVDQQLQGKDFDVIDKLLRNTVKNFARRVYNFDKNTGIYPFLDREKQSISMLLPSFADAADAVYCEQSVRRGKRRNGFLDYWILYRGNLFMIEVKAAFHAVSKRSNQKKPPGVHNKQKKLARLNTKWQKAERQVDGIDWEDLIGYAAIDEGKVKRKFRMILALVVLYKGAGPVKKSKDHSKVKNLERYKKEDIEPELSEVSSALSPRPNWSALLSFSNQQEVPYQGGRTEIYPGILFLCKVKQRRASPSKPVHRADIDG